MSLLGISHHQRRVRRAFQWAISSDPAECHRRQTGWLVGVRNQTDGGGSQPRTALRITLDQREDRMRSRGW